MSLCRLAGSQRWSIRSKRRPLLLGHLDSVLFQYEDQQLEELKHIEHGLHCFLESIS